MRWQHLLRRMYLRPGKHSKTWEPSVLLTGDSWFSPPWVCTPLKLRLPSVPGSDASTWPVLCCVLERVLAGNYLRRRVKSCRCSQWDTQVPNGVIISTTVANMFSETWQIICVTGEQAALRALSVGWRGWLTVELRSMMALSLRGFFLISNGNGVQSKMSNSSSLSLQQQQQKTFKDGTQKPSKCFLQRICQDDGAFCSLCFFFLSYTHGS